MINSKFIIILWRYGFGGRDKWGLNFPNKFFSAATIITGEGVIYDTESNGGTSNATLQSYDKSRYEYKSSILVPPYEFDSTKNKCDY